MLVKASGFRGTVLVGYDEAALLGPWTLELTTGGTVTVRAAVERANAFLLTQPRLTLSLEAGRSDWRWPMDGRAVQGRQLTFETTAAPDVRRAR